MTTATIDPELEGATEIDPELSGTSGGQKTPPVAQKVSKFSNAGFGGGSKFGKGPSGGANPQLKQRPGRAAARGR